jgi:hypothetical protein
METTEYLGYIIRKSNDPWMTKYNMPFEYFHPDGEGRVYGAASVQDCKDEIDSRLDDFLERLDKTTKAI